jgi:hypothetical protein
MISLWCAGFSRPGERNKHVTELYQQMETISQGWHTYNYLVRRGEFDRAKEMQLSPEDMARVQMGPAAARSGDVMARFSAEREMIRRGIFMRHSSPSERADAIARLNNEQGDWAKEISRMLRDDDTSGGGG